MMIEKPTITGLVSGWKEMRGKTADASFVWRPAVLCETDADICNPGRGWYQVFLLRAELEAPVSDWLGCVRENEKLALLFVSLQAYADKALDEAALLHIENGLRFFREQNKDVILRLAYDCDGSGIAHEPALSKIITGHMRQLKPALTRYEKTIFCIQGLFIGSWGEMHDSKFLSNGHLRQLWDEWYTCAPEGCFLAVRTPAQWRTIAKCVDLLSTELCSDGATAFKKSARKGDALQKAFLAAIRTLRLGLYNDGLCGSDTDLGTWLPEQTEAELDFQDRLCRLVPNGGEAVSMTEVDYACHDTDVGKAVTTSVRAVIRHFEKLHISYLNCVHDAAILEQWKNCQYNHQETAYSYIGKRLGYRFVVWSAVPDMRRQKLQLTIENQGFANCYEETELSLLISCGNTAENRNGTGDKNAPPVLKEILLQEDMRLWQAGERRRIDIDLREAVCDGTIYLKAVRKKDGCPIRFANKGAGDRLMLGRIAWKRNTR